jgi:hypothetical protein
MSDAQEHRGTDNADNSDNSDNSDNADNADTSYKPRKPTTVSDDVQQRLLAASSNKLMSAYASARDAIKVINSDAEKAAARYADVMDAIDRILLTRMSEEGVKSISGDDITAYTQTKRTVTLADRRAFEQWAMANNQIGMFQSRVSKSDVMNYIDATETTPPGINVTGEIGVTVRRKTAK